MDCIHINNQLSEYADGMLPEPVAAEVKQHLAGCSRCREAYESMLKIMDHMSRLEAIPEPPDLVAKVNARMDRRFSPAGWLKRLFVPLRFKLPLEAAALAAVALVIVRLWGVGGEPQMSGITALTPPEEREIAALKTETAEKGGKSRQPAEDVSEQAMEAAPLSQTADEELPAMEDLPEPGQPARKETLSDTDKLAAGQLPGQDLAVREKKTELDRLTEKAAPDLEGKTELKRLDVGKSVADKGKTEPKRPTLKKSLTRGGRSESLPPADAPSAVRLLTTGQLQLLVPDSLPKAADLTAIIQSLGGTLLSREEAGDPTGPDTLLVEIQAVKYPDLIRELGRLGEIQKSASPIPKNKLGSIRIKIVVQKTGS